MSRKYFRKEISGNGAKTIKWVEMSHEEYHHFICSPEGKGRFFIDMGDIVIEVSQDEARLYVAEKNHHDYISRQKKGWITISLYEAEKEKGLNGEEVLPDRQRPGVEDTVIQRIEIEVLYKALSLLDEESYSLISDLYLSINRKTECELAQEYGVSQAAICKRKKKILSVLKNLVIKIQKSQQ